MNTAFWASCFGVASAIALGVLVYCGCLFLSAWLLTMAWAAVMVPIFGLKAITLGQSIWLLVGFSIIAGMFRGVFSSSRKTE